MKYVIWILLSFIAMMSVGFAQEYILFYGNGCPHCAAVEEYITKNGVQQQFDLVLKEIYFNKNNLTELQWYLGKLSLDVNQIGVPFLVLNNQNECSYINGSTPIIDFFQKKIAMLAVAESWATECNTQTCEWLQCESQTLQDAQNTTNGNAWTQTPSSSQKSLSWSSGLIVDSIITWTSNNMITGENSFGGWKFFGIMLPAALSDSINPCAFAVMLLLLSSILSVHRSRRKTLLSGVLFVLAVFLSYFAMGVWLFSALATASNTLVLKLIVWILGVLVWLANLKDFFRYGKWFVMEVPFSRRPKLQEIIHKVTSPIGAFFVGIVVSLFLLPCSSWPYFTILWYMSSQSKELHTWWYIYLLVYNFLFILPMFAISILVSLGWASVDKLAKFKQEKTKLIHLIVWLLMLGLGIYVFTTI